MTIRRAPHLASRPRAGRDGVQSFGPAAAVIPQNINSRVGIEWQRATRVLGTIGGRTSEAWRQATGQGRAHTLIKYDR